MAFNESTHLNYNEKMRSFLNSHMRERRNISPDLSEKYTRDFSNAVELSFTVFGENAFRRYSEGNDNNPRGKWERSINKAVFDVVMFWFARYEKRQIIENKDEIRERYIKMCVADRDFNDAIMLGTAEAARVRTRFKKWGDALEEIIKVRPKERRVYSYVEKRQLYELEPTCGICKQQIEHIDDSEVDHIQPFSHGGETAMSNARLSHRYCNRSRGTASA
ncbi:HNH endonuclease [Mesorhizobium sp. M0051]|uniref:HNH endonuclease signature motif containing protein n=1 Tax=unclassified Mesorhizobium TaxID=325217 RepID=UPI000A064556|nr:HNH endonuclease signature motif containing protein [Mesorhizobium sp. LNHC252B00]